jgi:hypothetical protein
MASISPISTLISDKRSAIAFVLMPASINIFVFFVPTYIQLPLEPEAKGQKPSITNPEKK